MIDRFINRINNLLILALLISILLFGFLNYRKEDVNKDGRVDSLDLLKVKKYIMNGCDK